VVNIDTTTVLIGAITLCLCNDKVIYSVERQHILIINIINLATCFDSLNILNPQANS